MTAYFVNSYGGFAFANAVATTDDTLTVRSQNSTSVGRGGRYTAGSLMDTYSVTLAGTVLGADVGDPNDPASIRKAWDAVKGALRPGMPQKLMIDSDRYLMAEVSSDVKGGTWDGLPSRDWSATLASYDDPPWWASVPTQQVLGSGAFTLTSLGNGNAFPVLTFVLSAASTVSVTIGTYSFQFTTTGAGTFVMDSTSDSLITGGQDVTGLLSVASVWPELLPGDNAIQIAAANLTSASASWQDRWY